LADIAKQRGLPYVDLTDATRGEESVDGMHLSPAGLTKVGQAAGTLFGPA
jgi:hypothetical protein